MTTFAIAVLSLLVSISALLYTIWSNSKYRRIDGLQEVRASAVSNLSRFNGILNAAVTTNHSLSKQEFEELGRLYAEVRDAYSIRRRNFGKSQRQGINSKINSFEKKTWADDNRNGKAMLEEMNEIMNLIEIASR